MEQKRKPLRFRVRATPSPDKPTTVRIRVKTSASVPPGTVRIRSKKVR
jgi:hypothetical protein